MNYYKFMETNLEIMIEHVKQEARNNLNDDKFLTPKLFVSVIGIEGYAVFLPYLNTRSQRKDFIFFLNDRISKGTLLEYIFVCEGKYNPFYYSKEEYIFVLHGNIKKQQQHVCKFYFNEESWLYYTGWNILDGGINPFGDRKEWYDCFSKN